MFAGKVVMKPIAIIGTLVVALCPIAAHAKPVHQSSSTVPGKTTKISYPNFYEDWQIEALMPGRRYHFFACLDPRRLILKRDSHTQQMIIASVTVDSTLSKQLRNESPGLYCGAILAGVTSRVSDVPGPGSPPMVHVYAAPGLVFYREWLGASAKPGND